MTLKNPLTATAAMVNSYVFMKNKQRNAHRRWESSDFPHKSYNTTLGEAGGKCKYSEMETIIINY